MKPLWKLKTRVKQKLEVDGLLRRKSSMTVKRQKLKLDLYLKVFKKSWNLNLIARQLQKNLSNFLWHFWQISTLN